MGYLILGQVRVTECPAKLKSPTGTKKGEKLRRNPPLRILSLILFWFLINYRKFFENCRSLDTLKSLKYHMLENLKF